MIFGYKFSKLREFIQSRNFKKDCFVFLLIIFFLFNTTYQQYNHFDIDDPRGAGDANYYLKMSGGQYDIYQLARYRFVIPSLVFLLRRLSILPIDPGTQDPNQFAFYIVSFLITTITAFFIYKLNLSLNLNFFSSLFGTLIFVCSRPTIINVGTPHIDSFFNLAIILIAFFTVNKRLYYLSFLLPFLVLSKITILPFIFLPLFEKKFRNIAYYFSIIFSFISLFAVRAYIDYFYPCAICAEVNESAPFEANGHLTYFLWDFYNHAIRFFDNLPKLISPNGLFDFFMASFSIFFFMAIFGYIKRRKVDNFFFPNYLFLIVPISLYYSIISGNFGRMFFSSFPVFIPLASYYFEIIFYKKINNS